MSLTPNLCSCCHFLPLHCMLCFFNYSVMFYFLKILLTLLSVFITKLSTCCYLFHICFSFHVLYFLPEPQCKRMKTLFSIFVFCASFNNFPNASIFFQSTFDSYLCSLLLWSLSNFSLLIANCVLMEYSYF